MDEMQIKTKKDGWQWLWNIIDRETRFLIANNVTKERSSLEAQIVMEKAKKVIRGNNPIVVITDKLNAYPSAIKNTFGKNVIHISNAGIRGRIKNNLVERYNGTVRERDKVMRALDKSTTGKEIHEYF